MSELTERLRVYEKLEKPLADGPAVRGWNHMVRNQQEAADALEAQEALISELGAALKALLWQAPSTLSCGRRCQLETE